MRKLEMFKTEVTQAPILSLLTKMSIPNILAVSASVMMTVSDGIVLGSIGSNEVAAGAVVLPLLMLTTQVAASSVGGTVTALVSHLLGRSDAGRASTLAGLCLAGSLVIGILIAASFLFLAPSFLGSVSPTASVADAAYKYGALIFIATPFVFVCNTASAVIRAHGDVRFPAKVNLALAGMHCGLSSLFVLEIGEFRQLGILFPGCSFLVAFLTACLWQLRYFQRCPEYVAWFKINEIGLLREVITKSAAAALVPVLGNCTALIGAYYVARLGADALAAYSVGVRLEYVVVPVAYGVGLSLLTIVGMNHGAGLTARVRASVWSGASLSAGLIFFLTVFVVLWPSPILSAMGLNEVTLTICVDYMRTVGALYFVYGFGLTLFFASQALGRPLLGMAGSGVRCAVVVVGGYLWSTGNMREAHMIFLVMASGLIAYTATLSFALHRVLRPKCSIARAHASTITGR